MAQALRRHSLSIVVLLLPLLEFANLRDQQGLPRSMGMALPYLVFLSLLGGAWLPPVGDKGRRHVWPVVVGCLFLALMAPPYVRQASIAAALVSGACVALPRLGRAADFATAALFVTVSHWLLPGLLAFVKVPEAVGEALSLVLSAVGIHSAPTTIGVAIVPFGAGVMEVHTGLAFFGVREVLAIGSGVFCLWVTTGPPLASWRAFAPLTAALILALVVRSLIGLLLLAEGVPSGILADPWVRSVSLGLPWLGASLAFERVVAPSKTLEVSVDGSLSSGMLAFVCGAFLLAIAWFAPSEVPRAAEPAIAVDAYHSRWERMDLPLDQERSGVRTVYNYSEWVRGLEAKYEVVDQVQTLLSDELLNEYDVLVLKTPTEPLTVSEVDAVDRFVRSGGGLYLVGDHTNVFGMNDILNSVSKRYGIQYNADAVFEIDYEGGQVTDPRVLPIHPLVQSMRPLHWMTSCSISIERPARPIIWSSTAYADAPDFAQHSFFGDHQFASDEEFGQFVQLATAEVGDGRVLAFADSTLFSNFSIFLPGVRELAFGGVDWLTKRDRLRAARGPAALVALVLLAMAGLKNGRRLRATRGGVVLGLGLGLFVANLSARSASVSWPPDVAASEVVYAADWSSGQLPLFHESHDTERDYWSLFLSFQRSGGMMRVAIEDEDPFAGRIAIFVRPRGPVDELMIERAKKFVDDGGQIFLFEDKPRPGTVGASLASAFGMTFHGGSPLRSLALGASNSVDLTGSCATVLGGESLMFDTAGAPVAARAWQGRGCVVVSGLAADFSDHVLGEPGVLKDVRSRHLRRSLYYLLGCASDDGIGTASQIASEPVDTGADVLSLLLLMWDVDAALIARDLAQFSDGAEACIRRLTEIPSFYGWSGRVLAVAKEVGGCVGESYTLLSSWLDAQTGQVSRGRVFAALAASSCGDDRDRAADLLWDEWLRFAGDPIGVRVHALLEMLQIATSEGSDGFADVVHRVHEANRALELPERRAGSVVAYADAQALLATMTADVDVLTAPPEEADELGAEGVTDSESDLWARIGIEPEYDQASAVEWIRLRLDDDGPGADEDQRVLALRLAGYTPGGPDALLRILESGANQRIKDAAIDGLSDSVVGTTDPALSARVAAGVTRFLTEEVFAAEVVDASVLMRAMSALESVSPRAHAAVLDDNLAGLPPDVVLALLSRVDGEMWQSRSDVLRRVFLRLGKGHGVVPDATEAQEACLRLLAYAGEPIADIESLLPAVRSHETVHRVPRLMAEGRLARDVGAAEHAASILALARLAGVKSILGILVRNAGEVSRDPDVSILWLTEHLGDPGLPLSVRAALADGVVLRMTSADASQCLDSLILIGEEMKREAERLLTPFLVRLTSRGPCGEPILNALLQDYEPSVLPIGHRGVLRRIRAMTSRD